MWCSAECGEWCDDVDGAGSDRERTFRSMDQIVEEEGDAVEYDGGPPIDASSNDTNGIKDDDVNDDKDIRRDKEEVEEDRRHHHRRDDDRHTLTNDKVGA